MSSRRRLFASCLVVALTGAWAAVGAPAPEPVKAKDGPLGTKFVSLPKGTFYMGWDGTPGSGQEDGDRGRLRDRHSTTVTQGQWQELMGTTCYFLLMARGKTR